MGSIIRFKNISFFNYDFKYINKILSKKGGYLVAPAASSLVDIKKNKIYLNALIFSDIAIFDSGFFCLLLRFYKKIKVKKFSGYLYLSLFLDQVNIKRDKIFLIDPNKFENNKNSEYLRRLGFRYVSSYVAPQYNYSNYKDKLLLKKILSYNPKYIVLNLGGGIQEPLALFLNQNLKNKKKTVILCTGAAIGFLTKVQAPISQFHDKIYLGWLIRLIFRPKNYIKRVIKSLKLINNF
jgi:N-acetylglucosaminyldiphosphoundecaprenol N-acetyl-beta-D-mannosaminyltransferase